MVARILIKLHARNHVVTSWEGDLSQVKVYEETLRYVEGSHLTLAIILYSPIER